MYYDKQEGRNEMVERCRLMKKLAVLKVQTQSPSGANIIAREANLDSRTKTGGLAQTSGGGRIVINIHQWKLFRLFCVM